MIFLKQHHDSRSHERRKREMKGTITLSVAEWSSSGVEPFSAGLKDRPPLLLLLLLLRPEEDEDEDRMGRELGEPRRSAHVYAQTLQAC